jgi:hypothetical protein
MMKRVSLAALLLALSVVPAFAQEEEIRAAGVSRRVERQLLEFFADERTVRPPAPYEIPAGAVVRDNIGVVGGDVRVAGRLEGDLVVLNGDLHLARGGAITGDVMVVGGEATLEDELAIGGTLTVYGRTGGRTRVDRDDDGFWWPRPRMRRRTVSDDGIARFTVRTAGNYNRVEGLPLMFGPLVQTAGANPLRLEGYAIWRTHGTQLHTGDFGYDARVEQFLGGRRAFRLGAGAHSVVTPIENAGVTDLEASLAAFLLHMDLRDYRDREGWTAYARYAPRRGRLDAVAEFRDDRYRTAPAGDPWTLLRRNRAWRLQPVAAEGDLQSLRLAATWDDVRPTRRRARGTYARVTFEQGLSGDLTRPPLIAGFLDPDTVHAAFAYGSDVRHGSIDVRRHMRVTGGSVISVRGFAAGSLSDRTLPPQFQRALGGPGTLPGLSTFAGDCGARRSAWPQIGTEPLLYPAYGCDRVALVQLEYAGGLAFDFGFGEPREERDGWRFDVDSEPSWVFFADAGRGWTMQDAAHPGAEDTELLVDAGVGFLLGRAGIYAAIPVRGADRRVNVFVRLGRRF